QIEVRKKRTFVKRDPQEAERLAAEEQAQREAEEQARRKLEEEARRVAEEARRMAEENKWTDNAEPTEDSSDY
ncbi:hypothetical protein U0A81_25520, partial [Escherichia coli]|nr:hypothetical protein [Escherichia coli]